MGGKRLAQSTFSKSITDSVSSLSSAFPSGCFFSGCKRPVMDPLPTAQRLVERAPSLPLTLIRNNQSSTENRWMGGISLTLLNVIKLLLSSILRGIYGGRTGARAGPTRPKSRQTELSSLVRTWLMVGLWHHLLLLHSKIETLNLGYSHQQPSKIYI